VAKAQGGTCRCLVDGADKDGSSDTNGIADESYDCGAEDATVALRAASTRFWRPSSRLGRRELRSRLLENFSSPRFVSPHLEIYILGSFGKGNSLVAAIPVPIRIKICNQSANYTRLTRCIFLLLYPVAIAQ